MCGELATQSATHLWKRNRRKEEPITSLLHYVQKTKK
jgi:hypothetical protein